VLLDVLRIRATVILQMFLSARHDGLQIYTAG